MNVSDVQTDLIAYAQNSKNCVEMTCVYSVFISVFNDIYMYGYVFLSQARAGRTWFLKIDPVRIIGIHACMCVRARGY